MTYCKAKLKSNGDTNCTVLVINIDINFVSLLLALKLFNDAVSPKYVS
jgi:hypothetical protein